MILKHADAPDEQLRELDGLLSLKLNAWQRAEIRKQAYRLRQGARGEREVAHFLDTYFYDRDQTVVLHDVRLVLDEVVMQFDHLVLTAEREAYVIETKNYGGQLSSNDRGEWVVSYGSGKVQPIASPIEQALMQVRNLGRWMKWRGWSTFVGIHAVVMVPPRHAIPEYGKVAGAEFIKADNVRRWWENRYYDSVLQGMWRRATKLSPPDLLTMAKAIADRHAPLRPDWRARFGIDPDARPVASAPPPEPVPRAASPIPSTPAAPPAAPPVSVAPSSVVPSAATPDRVRPATDVPGPIDTPFGTVTARRVPDGSVALRHPENAELAEHVRVAVGERGRWQPRYRNWLVDAGDLPGLAARLRAEPVAAAAPPTVAIQAAAGPAGVADPAEPDAIETPFGVVTLKRASDGSVALRHGGGDELIEHVRTVVRGHGRWQPRFRNWLVAEADLAGVIARLRGPVGAGAG